MTLTPQLLTDRTLTPSNSPDYLASVPMTFDEFIAWEYNRGLVEWVDGTSYVYMSASSRHQRTLAILQFLLYGWADATGAGEVLSAPYAMRASAGGPGREPDLMFIAAQNRGRIQSGFLAGAPDLAVEIVSTDSVARDRETKRDEYAAAGVREYWIVESRGPFRWAEFLVLREGAFVEAAAVDGVYRSEVAEGFWLRTEWLWDEELRAMDALQEILGGGPDQGPGAGRASGLT